jgi:hypothetical protein
MYSKKRHTKEVVENKQAPPTPAEQAIVDRFLKRCEARLPAPHLTAKLVKSGWLRETTTPTAGRTIRRWEVNPKLFTYSGAESAESAGAESD